MVSKIIRVALMSIVVASLAGLSGCCGCGGCCSGVCQVYQHPEPSCCGLHYAGSCTCKDDCRDRINQLTDIFLP